MPAFGFGRFFTVPAWREEFAPLIKGMVRSGPKPIHEIIVRTQRGKRVYGASEQRGEDAVRFQTAHPCGKGSSLTISGDGTSVHAHSNPNGHILPSPAHTLSQQEYASLPRHYSDPDASWGWDSDLDSFYFGYTLFQLSCHNPVLLFHKGSATSGIRCALWSCNRFRLGP